MKAGNKPPGGNEIVAQRDQLVQTTRDKLRQVMSANGMASFDAHIQAEKQGMRVMAQKETVQ
ncbi:MAG: hypothetical protein JOZ33_17610 [Acidobacteriaceae bacterium]|nr:hypothetical protein [Acidobacteriaceae bacterium]